MATPANDPSRRFVGQRIGPYEVVDVLGRGGMGVVFRARQVSLGRDVALKMMLGGSWAAEEARTRFINEARLMARLQHPGLVRIHDAGFHEDSVYYSMDLVRGASLDSIIDRLDPVRLAACLARVAETLHYVHQNGLVHRDIKPANILIPEDGNPILMDFGLAKNVTSGEGLTVEGAVLGTPAYMAPEQAAGELERVDARADIFALGAVLYRGIAHRPPYEGATPMSVIAKVIMGPPPAPSAVVGSGVPPALERICLKAMAREPKDRYSDAAALARDLQQFASGPVPPPPPTARPAGPSGRQKAVRESGRARRSSADAGLPPVRPRGSPVPYVVGALVVAAVLGVYALTRHGPSGRPAGGGSASPAPQPEDAGGAGEDAAVAAALALPERTWGELEARRRALADLASSLGSRAPQELREAAALADAEVSRRRSERERALENLRRAAVNGDLRAAEEAARLLDAGTHEPAASADVSILLDLARIEADSDRVRAWADFERLAPRVAADLVRDAERRLQDRIAERQEGLLADARSALLYGHPADAVAALDGLLGDGEPFRQWVASHRDEIESLRRRAVLESSLEPPTAPPTRPPSNPPVAGVADRTLGALPAVLAALARRDTEAARAGAAAAGDPSPLGAIVDATASLLAAARAGAEGAAGHDLRMGDIEGEVVRGTDAGLVLELAGGRWRFLVRWARLPSQALRDLAARSPSPPAAEAAERAAAWLDVFDGEIARLDAAVAPIEAAMGADAAVASARLRALALLAAADSLAGRGRPDAARAALDAARHGPVPPDAAAAVERRIQELDQAAPGSAAYLARFRSTVDEGRLEEAARLAERLPEPLDAYASGTVALLRGRAAGVRDLQRVLRQDPRFDPVNAGLFGPDGYAPLPLAGHAILLPDGRTRLEYGFDDAAELRDWLLEGPEHWRIEGGILVLDRGWVGYYLRVPFVRLDCATLEMRVTPDQAEDDRFVFTPQTSVSGTRTYQIHGNGSELRLLYFEGEGRNPTTLQAMPIRLTPGEPLRLSVACLDGRIHVATPDGQMEVPTPEPYREPNGWPFFFFWAGTDLDHVVFLGEVRPAPAHPCDWRFEDLVTSPRPVSLAALRPTSEGSHGSCRWDEDRAEIAIGGPADWGWQTCEAQFLRLAPMDVPFEMVARVEGSPGVGGITLLHDDGRHIRFDGRNLIVSTFLRDWECAKWAAQATRPWIRIRRFSTLYWVESSPDGEHWESLTGGPFLFAGETVAPAFYARTDAAGQATVRFTDIRIRVGRR